VQRRVRVRRSRRPRRGEPEGGGFVRGKNECTLEVVRQLLEQPIGGSKQAARLACPRRTVWTVENAAKIKAVTTTAKLNATSNSTSVKPGGQHDDCAVRFIEIEHVDEERDGGDQGQNAR